MNSDENVTASRAAGLVTVQLGAELKLRWTQQCAAQGVVPGKALRGLVEGAVSGALTVGAALPKRAFKAWLGSQPDRGPKVGREVQFTLSENAAIEAAAKARGFAFQEWVAAATRGALVQAAAFGQTELEALTQSNARLAAVVMDLAAVRRQLGEGGGAITEQITELESEIRQHVEKVSAVMAQGAQRWEIRI